jgi:beta-mannosidase
VSPAASPARAPLLEHEVQRLDHGWQLAASEPDACTDPSGLDALSWREARVPGTVAGAVGPDEWSDLDASDWWFRARFEAEPAAVGEEVVLHLDGIATVSEVHLNGELLAESNSMFVRHRVAVGSLLRGSNEIAIRCHALGPLLAVRRKPRARWRTRLVDGNLRFFRTMLLGRAPGFAPGPPVIGPWRGICLERRRDLVAEEIRLRTRLEGPEGVLAVRARLRSLSGDSPANVEVELSGPSGVHGETLEVANDCGALVATGELTVPSVDRWWPHTHGTPTLHNVNLLVGSGPDQRRIPAGRVGFRSIAAGPEPDRDATEAGLDLHVNGERVFARGALWTPLDPVGMAPSEAELREALEQARDGGMNMLRIPGTAAYETSTFHDLCDELGLLVWQDFMFANLDYPVDGDFRATVTDEACAVMGDLAGRPATAVLCGNSEIEQQVAMLGLDPALGRGELFGELLPGIVSDSGSDAVYLPSAPCGGELPFRPHAGVANYFGVGGYMRPLEDARRAEVRFASECLAISNVPDEANVAAMGDGGPVIHDPAWKAGVPRDSGADWDFEDVRDHYLEMLFGLDPAELRAVDHERYLELSRAVSGEVMAEVFGEWRRGASPCGGGLVLWLRDLVPGAGWGLIDSLGEPKVAYHHLRRALAPAAVWMTDEGLNGIGVHIANDRPEPWAARLRIALYRDHEQLLEEAVEELELEPNRTIERDLEAVIGRFVDSSWSYRFGRPAQDLIVASLETGEHADPSLVSQAIRFPAARPTGIESASTMELEASAAPLADGTLELRVRSRRLAYGVRIHAPGFSPSDNAFSVEPGHERRLLLRPREDGAVPAGVALTALNLDGRVRVTTDPEPSS